MSSLGEDEQIQEYQSRFHYLYIALGISLSILLFRLWYLQIMSGQRFRQYSEENHIKKVKITSPRGMVFDRNHTILLDNRPVLDLEVTPQELYASKNWQKTIEHLAKIIQAPTNDILEILDEAKSQPSFLPVRIKQDLTDEEVAVIDAHKLDLPGVGIQMDVKRTNLYKDLAAHLMGYIGEINTKELPQLNKNINVDSMPYKKGDVTGKSGLEARWEQILRGIDGEEYIEVDVLGHRRTLSTNLTSDLKKKPSVPGKNLVLTIDQDLQMAALNAFEKLYGGKKIGAVIALNPKTGEVLVDMSQPSFDPTLFARGVKSQVWSALLNNEYHPLRDKTIQDPYSPGSTFKLITAIAGLEERVIDEKTTFTCPGSMQVGNRVFHCHKKNGHGAMNVVSAISQSCDIFFYKLGQKLGINTIAKYARMLGLGQRTGINLAHENSGLIPTEEWKKERFGQSWNEGETLSSAIGQSYVLVTPVQLANVYAAIANGGTFFKPYIVKAIETPSGQILQKFKSESLGHAKISQKTLNLVKQGLWNVVNSPHGTAYAHRISGLDISGKTGSIQLIRLSEKKIHQDCKLLPFHLRDNGLFVAFAPSDDPTIAVAVITEHSCHGGTGASPIVFAVIKAYLQKYYPERYSDAAIKERLKKAKIEKTVVLPMLQDEDEPAEIENPDVIPVLPELEDASERSE